MYHNLHYNKFYWFKLNDSLTIVFFDKNNIKLKKKDKILNLKKKTEKHH